MKKKRSAINYCRSAIIYNNMRKTEYENVCCSFCQIFCSQVILLPKMSLKFIKPLRRCAFLLLDFNYFCQFFEFNDVSINQIISAVFWLRIIVDRLLKNCIKYSICLCSIVINIALVSLPIWSLERAGRGGIILTHPE